MNLSENGANLIKGYEALRLEAYLCPAKVWTIGWGSTGRHVKPGLRITKAQAEALFRGDVARFEAAVARHTAGVALAQAHYDALVSFAFNVGISAFANSTLLKRVRQRDAASAVSEFARWNKANGKVSRGLVRRRKDEANLFLKGGALG